MVTIIYRVVASAVMIGLTIWGCIGWRDWLRNPHKIASLAAVCAFLGFTSASISLLLELVTGAYTHFGFRAVSDPSMLGRLYTTGFITALIGLGCSLVSYGPTRWKARAITVVLLILWAGQIAGTVQVM